MAEVKEKIKESENEEKGLAKYQRIAGITHYQAEIIAVMHKTVAKDTTVAELTYFLTVVKSLGLNPINREVWCYKNKQGDLIVFTGRDGFLVIAQRHAKYNGLRSCEVCEKDEFSIDIANNEIIHKFGVEVRGKIIGAYAIAFVKNSEPTIEWARMSDYDKGWNTWKSNPADMIKKVAESHALKKAFGISNLNSEYDFVIKDNVAVSVGEFTEAEVVPDSDIKAEERLLKLIEAAPTREKLMALKAECNTEIAGRAYDKRWKEVK